MPVDGTGSHLHHRDMADRRAIGACALGWLAGFAATTRVGVVVAVVAWVWAIPTALVFALFWIDHRSARRAPAEVLDVIDLRPAPAPVRPLPSYAGELGAPVLATSTR